MKYRKRPVVIEAVQLCRDTWQEICHFADVGKLTEGKPEGCYLDTLGQPLTPPDISNTMGLLIPTREGVMIAAEGDFVIRGVKGEFYPCKPDIFAMTYELVTEDEI